jgi:hypothetical protein
MAFSPAPKVGLKPWTNIKWNYCKLLMQFLLANMEAATRHAKSTSVLDAVIWIAEVAKQVSPEGVQTCF